MKRFRNWKNSRLPRTDSPADVRRPGEAGVSLPRRLPGFSLIELVVALALLALVLTLIYGSFFQISLGTKSINEQLSERQELRLLMKIIVEDLQSARFFRQFASAKEGNPSGIKADVASVNGVDFTDIRFHAAVASRFHRKVPPGSDPEMHEIAYRVENSKEDPNKSVLVRREDFFLDDDMEHGGITVVLTHRITKFKVSFLAKALQAGATLENWSEDWNSTESGKVGNMPVAVRVTLARERANGNPLEETLEANLLESMKVGK